MPYKKNKGANSERKGLSLEEFTKLYYESPVFDRKKPEKEAKFAEFFKNADKSAKNIEKSTKNVISGYGMGKISGVSTYRSRHAFKKPTVPYPTDKEQKIEPNQAFKKKKHREEIDKLIDDTMLAQKTITGYVDKDGNDVPVGYDSWDEVPDAPEDEDYDIDDIFDNPEGN